MNHLDLAFMLVFTALASTAFTAGATMLYLAKALNVESRRWLDESIRLRAWIEHAESECLTRFGQAPTDMFGEALAGFPAPGDEPEELTGRTVDHEGNRA